MAKPFNPLLDKHRAKELSASEESVPNIELLASGENSPPLSPSTGKPMEFAKCRNVPVWVCPTSRLVVPFKKVS